jgi:dolichol-phosphate mannosyltransferase
MKKIVVVIPCFNEQGNIFPMYDRLKKVFENLKKYDYSFIFVNNGSIDNSDEIFRKLAKKDKKVKVIYLSRNFYKSQGAYSAGIDYSDGDGVVLIDGDIQDPPEKIPDLIKKWEKGYDIVYGIRVKRKGSKFRKFAYKLFYRLFHKLSYLRIPVDAGDFSLIDKKIVKIISKFPERNRYIRGLRAWVGFKSIGVPYVRDERKTGMTTNSLVDNIKWAFFAIVSFSYAPLNLISWLAFVTVVLTLIAIVIYTTLYFIFPGNPRGFQTLLLVVLFLGGIQLICFAIIAQYLGVMFEEIKGRPKYIVEKILNDKQK